MRTYEIWSCRIEIKIEVRTEELPVLLFGKVKELLAFLAAAVLSEYGRGEIEVRSLGCSCEGSGNETKQRKSDQKHVEAHSKMTIGNTS